MNRHLRDRLVALFSCVTLLSPLGAYAMRKPAPARTDKVQRVQRVQQPIRFGVQRPTKLQRAAIDPHSFARALKGRSLAYNLPARPTTKLGRFVSVLGKMAGAVINAPKVGTPEGVLGQVQNAKAYVDGVKIEDVQQGHLADCFFVAALASVAFTHPELLEKAITEKPDGTMSIRLYHQLPSGKYEADDVRIDKLVPMTNGRPTFARGANSTQMWPAWMQKAYAVEVSNANGEQPNYQSINNGGMPGDALSALTGKPSHDIAISPSLGAGLYTSLQQAIKAKHPITALSPKKLPAGAPVHEWHTYSVMGVSTHDGKQWVQVRNPWGYSEPGDPNGGDGIFEITLEDFQKSFTTVSIGG